ncbi:MAG: hypothetical protein B6D61_08040 [Bacteroidetes bacterium 4484_249]|nr:MAG: hypothetical protein B6D61_08040 [Bacteroidetes bacterium 4484_249]
MEFVNPGFLYGLIAISIPVIIHLFNFRRFKKVYFTNVSFIKELKLQTQKQSRLKHLLILLMRILAIAAIVLAFAQPFIPISENIIKPNEKNAVSIYIDNSFSMEAESEKGTLLDEAKEKAKEIAGVYKSSDLFQLLTNDFEGRHQRFVSREEFENLVGEVTISPVVKTIQEIIVRQTDLLSDNPARQKTAYEISDFQKGIVNGEINVEDSAVNVFFIPLRAINADNLYIDSCRFSAPVQQVSQSVELKIKIGNSSANAYEKIPVKLKINGQQKALASFDIDPDSFTEITLSYTNYDSGIQYGELEITDYPVMFDDKFYFSYYVTDVTPVLCINGNAHLQNGQSENVYINSMFANDSSFLFRNVNEGNIDYSSLESYQLIIFNGLKEISTGLAQEAKRFVSNGGSLVIFPSEDINFDSYRSFMNSMNVGHYTSLDTADTRVSYINLEHPLFNDVFDEIPENIDLPYVFKNYRISVVTQSRQESLLEMQTGGVFLNMYPVEGGKVYLFAVALQTSFSNFPKHAIFVPTMYKIAVSSVIEDNLYYTIGDRVGNDFLFY